MDWFCCEGQDCKIELIIFSDASKLVYRAVVYVKVSNNKTKIIKCTFISAKSRLAPLKQKSLTIPKLELQAAVLVVRLKEKMIHQVDFELNEIHICSDSQTILSVRNSERKFPTFVMHRLNEIRKSTETEQWNYIPGKFNIADMCTQA